MSKVYSARQVGEKMDLTHHEVIRRIRRGDIKATKVGWSWVITEEWIQTALGSDWYKRRLARLSETDTNP
jgi:hypothetical protein